MNKYVVHRSMNYFIILSDIIRTYIFNTIKKSKLLKIDNFIKYVSTTNILSLQHMLKDTIDIDGEYAFFIELNKSKYIESFIVRIFFGRHCNTNKKKRSYCSLDSDVKINIGDFYMVHDTYKSVVYDKIFGRLILKKTDDKTESIFVNIEHLKEYLEEKIKRHEDLDKKIETIEHEIDKTHLRIEGNLKKYSDISIVLYDEKKNLEKRVDDIEEKIKTLKKLEMIKTDLDDEINILEDKWMDLINRHTRLRNENPENYHR